MLGESMGGHFNPSNMPHGLPSEAKHHLGDPGNIEIDEDGDGKLKVLVPDANLEPGDRSFVAQTGGSAMKHICVAIMMQSCSVASAPATRSSAGHPRTC